ncbi:MAG TPA: hypothetical protein VNC78_00940 [Actinomycetota bacterium]|nr:hypothetical protein [Actinomycetota bacterium]
MSIAIATIALLSAGVIQALGPRVEAASETSSSTLADSAVEQAAWKLKTVEVGSARGHGVQAAGKDVSAIVREVYDALLLQPAGLSASLEAHFARDAASALVRAGLGWPEDTTGVRVIKRRARVHVELGSSPRAVAIVRTIATGETPSGPLRLKQRSTLWIEESKGGWRVFAFDVDQRPSR